MLGCTTPEEALKRCTFEQDRGTGYKDGHFEST
jgi:hypothetical protein